MWPRENILFLAPEGMAEDSGMLCLLRALHRDVVVRTPSGLAVDMPGQRFFAKEDSTGDQPATEIVYWPGVEVQDALRQWGKVRDLLQREIGEYLSSIWDGELIIPTDMHPQFQGEPVLYAFLKEAQFEPSLIWKTKDGQWITQINTGIHWVVEKDWLKAIGGKEDYGRKAKYPLSEIKCCRQNDRINFFGTDDSAFIGSLGIGEDDFFGAVAQALQLGVPWYCINKVLDREKGNADDFRGHEGQSGTQLST